MGVRNVTLGVFFFFDLENFRTLKRDPNSFSSKH